MLSSRGDATSTASNKARSVSYCRLPEKSLGSSSSSSASSSSASASATSASASLCSTAPTVQPAAAAAAATAAVPVTPLDHPHLTALRIPERIELHRSSSGRNLRLKHVTNANVQKDSSHVLTPRAPSARRPFDRVALFQNALAAAGTHASVPPTTPPGNVQATTDDPVLRVVALASRASTCSSSLSSSMEDNQAKPLCCSMLDQLKGIGAGMVSATTTTKTTKTTTTTTPTPTRTITATTACSVYDTMTSHSAPEIVDLGSDPERIFTFDLWKNAAKTKALPSAILQREEQANDVEQDPTDGAGDPPLLLPPPQQPQPQPQPQQQQQPETPEHDVPQVHKEDTKEHPRCHPEPNQQPEQQRHEETTSIQEPPWRQWLERIVIDDDASTKTRRHHPKPLSHPQRQLQSQCRQQRQDTNEEDQQEEEEEGEREEIMDPDPPANNDELEHKDTRDRQPEQHPPFQELPHHGSSSSLCSLTRSVSPVIRSRMPSSASGCCSTEGSITTATAEAAAAAAAAMTRRSSSAKPTIRFTTNSEGSHGSHGSSTHGASASPSHASVASSAPTVDDKKAIIKWKRGELIGEGTFGKVYKALNSVTGELFVIKQIDIRISTLSDADNERDRLKQIHKLGEEISLMKNLSHPHIVRYKGCHRSDSRFFIFMEYVPGGSIASMLKQFEAFSEELIRIFTRQIVEGVAYLHSKGIIHRDIKGANVLVSEHGVAKLADFGCSKELPQIKTTSLEESLRSIRGSVPWMAPEVVKQSGHGFKADIWSIGATVIEMATAKHPWPECTNNLSALFTIAMAKSPPTLPKHLSVLAQDFLCHCLCIEPEERATAQELLKHAFLAG